MDEATAAAIAELPRLQGKVLALEGQYESLLREVRSGSALENSTSISGFKLNSGQSDPNVADSTTYVGTGAMLLTAGAITLSRPANTPYLMISVTGVMNADYVVASDGSGTHLTLYGASGALQAALATGLSKSIWVCTTHSETVTTPETISTAMGTNQIITIASLGLAAATIHWGNLSGAAAHKFTNISGANARIQFENINLYKDAGSDPFYETASGKTMPNFSFTDVSWNGTVQWSFVVDMANSGTGSPQDLRLDRCRGAGLASVVRTVFNTPAINALFAMRGCVFTGLATISQRDTEAAPEWGGSNANHPGVLIENNRLTNVSDAESLSNPKADRPVGLEAPLKFECGVRGEFTVDGWKAGPAPK